ncbi:hypothetical protein D3C87_1579440 [compost metagenome]
MSLPLFRNQVQAAPAMPFRLQPILRHQPEDTGAQQAFVDAQRGQQFDQVAQPDGAAMRRERVPQQADAEGFGARGVAFQQAGQETVQRRRRVCHRVGQMRPISGSAI